MGGDQTTREVRVVQSYAKSMILSSYLYLTCLKVLYRLICSSVSKFQFIGIKSKSTSQDLMAKTYSENWLFTYQFFNLFDRIGHAGRIPWSVGEKNSIRIKF